MNYNYFYNLHIWVSGLIFILCIFAALEVGYRVAIKERDT